LSAAAMPAWAQARSDAEIRKQYLADREACERRYTGEALQTCLREAGAAAQAARQGELAGESDEERYRRNALARCAPLPPEQREACRMRIEGAGTVRGSVEGGGLYRELRIREPAPQAAQPAPAPAPATTAPAVTPSATPPSTTAPSAPPATTVAPATTTPPTVVAPMPTAPAPASPPVSPGAGLPGGPTFTPVQPVVPGRTPPPAAAPAAPSAGAGAPAPSGAARTVSPVPPPSLPV